MRAAVIVKVDAPVEIHDVELTPLQVGQVKVRIIVSGLCGSQLQELSGLKGNAKFMPHLFGHEGCGIVEEVGAGVTKVKVGDKVVMHWRIGAGIESPFPSYVLNGKSMTSGKVTTLSEYSIVSENRLTAVPSDTPEDLCALLGCGLTTALGTITNEAELKFGESVMVIGCGGVGLNLIQGAKMASAYPIIAVDVADEKKDLCLKMGASSFINSRKESVKTALNTNKVDVIMDASGCADVVGNSIEFLSDRGRYIIVGQFKPEEKLNGIHANTLFLGQGKTIKATQGGKTNPQEDIARYVKLHKAGLLNIRGLVTHEFPLTDINKAVETLRSGKVGRILIRMN